LASQVNKGAAGASASATQAPSSQCTFCEFFADRWHWPQQSGMLWPESPFDQLRMEFAVAMTRILRPLTLFAVLSLIAPWTAHADAPSACKFLTPALVSAAVGKPVTGGTTSVLDHAGASASSCTYVAGKTYVVLSVDERGTAAEAMKEYADQLDNSHIRNNRDNGKTVLEPGLGEAAFFGDSGDNSEVSITSVHGSRVFTLGFVSAGSIPHDRIRSLMQTALSH
jgi:hypothetical protein